jgi:transposase
MKHLLEELEASGERCTPGFRSAFLALQTRVVELEALVYAQAEEIRELKRRLKQNSANSSLPPSSDPPDRKVVRRKKKSGRRRGAQPGHEAHQRRLLPEEWVDHIEDHYPTLCRHCGEGFALWQEVGPPERRQVIELPEVKATLIEHRLHRLCCPGCGGVTPAIAPAAVRGPLSFGARLVAFAALLTVRLRASRRNLHQVLRDLLDLRPPCVGALQGLLEEASAACLPAYREVERAVRQSPAVAVDETTWWLRRRQYWLWTAATGRLSFYRLHRHRSGWARERLLGKHYGGIVTSDRLGAYNGIPPPRRQLCWAHLIRAFADWQSEEGAAQRIAQGAEQCAKDLFTHWHGYRRGEYERGELVRRLEPVQEKLHALLEDGRSCGVSRIQKNCKQLVDLWPALWTFAHHAEVEPTNNEAERTLRAGVIWRKTSFGSQSGRGLRLVERLLTVAETCKKQKKNLLGTLTALITAHCCGGCSPALPATS